MQVNLVDRMVLASTLLFLFFAFLGRGNICVVILIGILEVENLKLC